MLQQFFKIKKDSDSAIDSKLSKALHKLKEEVYSSKIGPLNQIFKDQDLPLFQELADLTRSYKKVLVLGVGGSSLGAKTICSLKENSKINFLESIDPVTINSNLEGIKFDQTFFIIISKSGETIETVCQTLLLIEKIKEKGSKKSFFENFLFICENPHSTIGKIANKIGARIENHPSDVGGRYSCFSIVGMLPSLIAGINISKIRKGASDILSEFITNSKDTEESVINQIKLYDLGYHNNVIMPYIDNLKNFTEWYRQLWSESLGKKKYGSTPINSMGTVDQHSQLQLYLDGPSNKFFTFITCKKFDYDFKVKDLDGLKTIFGGKDISQIVKIEHDATIDCLKEQNLPVRVIELSSLNEETLGKLMMQMILETILISYCQDINPFDQPAVEYRKEKAKKLLKKT